jgi:hypothetical protein
MLDIPDDHLGPAVCQYLVRPPTKSLDDKQRDDLAAALRDSLDRFEP